MEQQVVYLAGVVILGMAAQWIAWRFELPAILILLACGFAAGQAAPSSQYIDDRLFYPIVSLSVAVIMFEGGLSLHLSELREIGGVVLLLVTVGALATWLLSTGLLVLIFGFTRGLASVAGAILVVSGPTVIIPLLRQVRPLQRIGSVVKWEGIVIDPVGAMLAVLVFEFVRYANYGDVARGVATTVLVGGLGGTLVGLALIEILKRQWIPDFLENSILLSVVFGAFAASNVLQAESGLVTVTVLGFVLVNQKTVVVHHLIEFKEHLRVLLISVLFILLASRIEVQQMLALGVRGLIFLAALILIVRPTAVLLATARSSLSWRERGFLASLAPRGIVAAAVSSIFALEFEHSAAYDAISPELAEQARLLAPLTFLVIVGTVTIYGLGAAPLGRWLGIADPNPQGILFVGADPFVRAIAAAVKSEDIHVVVVDRSREKIQTARMAGLATIQADILSKSEMEQYDYSGLGRLLAMTPNNEVNSLAALQFSKLFSRAEVYQLAEAKSSENGAEPAADHLRGRTLFDTELTYARLAQRFAAGAVVKTTPLTDEFDYDDFREMYGERAVLLFVVDEAGNLLVDVAENALTPRPGQDVISLVDVPPEE